MPSNVRANGLLLRDLVNEAKEMTGGELAAEDYQDLVSGLGQHFDDLPDFKKRRYLEEVQERLHQ